MSRTKELRISKKVREEVDVFKTEYPDYTAETVDAYIALLDDYSPSEVEQFIHAVGF